MKIPSRTKPGPGQESVWDYPRPPGLENSPANIIIIFNNITIVATQRAKRVLETSHPPVYYIPPEDIQMQYLQSVSGSSFCEWKGLAKYYDLNVDDKHVAKAGWYYSDPTLAFKAIKDYVAFYAAPMDVCFVDGERVRPQPGGFYGGWITTNIVGPFKGETGTIYW